MWWWDCKLWYTVLTMSFSFSLRLNGWSHREISNKVEKNSKRISMVPTMTLIIRFIIRFYVLLSDLTLRCTWVEISQHTVACYLMELTALLSSYELNVWQRDEMTIQNYVRVHQKRLNHWKWMCIPWQLIHPHCTRNTRNEIVVNTIN